MFLDRDGTINVKAPEGSYVCSPAQLRLLPHAGKAVRALNDAGIPVLVVTNQQGVASGRMSLADVHHVHKALEDRLRRFGAKLDGFYVCPHANGTCGCRKPAPGLFFQARREHPGLRFDHTVMIGDSRNRRTGRHRRRSPGHQAGQPGRRVRGQRVYSPTLRPR